MKRAEITTKQVILEAQEAFAGLADKLGLKTEDDVVNLCRKIRLSALSPDMFEAVEDTRLRRNLIGPFKTAEEAVAAMSEE